MPLIKKTKSNLFEMDQHEGILGLSSYHIAFVVISKDFDRRLITSPSGGEGAPATMSESYRFEYSDKTSKRFEYSADTTCSFCACFLHVAS